MIGFTTHLPDEKAIAICLFLALLGVWKVVDIILWLFSHIQIV